MKRTFALLVAAAFVGIAACETEPDEDDIIIEDVDVTPAPEPVVTDTFVVDTPIDDTMPEHDDMDDGDTP